MNNLIVLAVCFLVGCHDVAFDYFGKTSQSSAPNKSYGELVKCKTDDQCGQNFSFLKEQDNPTGVCMELK